MANSICHFFFAARLSLVLNWVITFKRRKRLVFFYLANNLVLSIEGRNFGLNHILQNFMLTTWWSSLMAESFLVKNREDTSLRLNIIQYCDYMGEDIPRFCYHENLKIAGNCRMCLVEVSGVAKAVASCAVSYNKNSIIYINSNLVKKCRENILEFLLINHPLDCPICDQGGECDLQDQSMLFGSDRGRYYEPKRAVIHKDFGPFVKVFLNRCIHCTRCVRFLTEVAGYSFLGMSVRGSKMEISDYLQSFIKSEFSGNIIDLCPVGALTAKPYSFETRPWEYEKYIYFDVIDSVGSSVVLCVFQRKVRKVLPRLNIYLNDLWISDRTRFFFDSLIYQRISLPYINIKYLTDEELAKEKILCNLGFISLSWDRIIFMLFRGFKSSFFNYKYSYSNYTYSFNTGSLVELESLYSLKELGGRLGSSSFIMNSIGCQQGSVDLRSQYILGCGDLRQLLNYNLLLLININLRKEVPIVNLHIRRRYLNDLSFIVGVIGLNDYLTYTSVHLGNNCQNLLRFLEGTHLFCNIFFKFENPLLFIGSSLLKRKDSFDFFNLLKVFFFRIYKIFNNSITYYSNCYYINPHISNVGSCELNFQPGSFSVNIFSEESLFNKQRKRLNFFYIVGVFLQKNITNFFNSCKIIYQGHTGLHLLEGYVDVILPGSTFVEKSTSFLNISGFLQKTENILFPVYEVRIDWEIIRTFSWYLSVDIKYVDYSLLYNKLGMYSPYFIKIIDNLRSYVFFGFLFRRVYFINLNKLYLSLQNILYTRIFDNLIYLNLLTYSSKVLQTYKVRESFFYDSVFITSFVDFLRTKRSLIIKKFHNTSVIID